MLVESHQSISWDFEVKFSQIKATSPLVSLMLFLEGRWLLVPSKLYRRVSPYLPKTGRALTTQPPQHSLCRFHTTSGCRFPHLWRCFNISRQALKFQRHQLHQQTRVIRWKFCKLMRRICRDYLSSEKRECSASFRFRGSAPEARSRG